MWMARIGSTARRDWHVVLHMPLPSWRGPPSYEPDLRHIPKVIKDRAQLAFPNAELVLKGIYFRKGDDQ